MLIVRSLAVGLTWIIYDHVLTFDLELKYIWKRGQWDYIKVYFLWNRYVGEVCLILGVYRKSGRLECSITYLLKSRMVSHGRSRREFNYCSECLYPWEIRQTIDCACFLWQK